ncbi:MAG: hypothetical protein JRD05_10785 [Deltaproteobacteria bacterium]|nr:hypothetical protein [Deltaproteobacteria bacterium]
MGSYYLFANPSFTTGMARILDLGTTLNEYNSVLSPEEADYLAIKSDWMEVGADMFSAIRNYDEKAKQEQES